MENALRRAAGGSGRSLDDVGGNVAPARRGSADPEGRMRSRADNPNAPTNRTPRADDGRGAAPGDARTAQQIEEITHAECEVVQEREQRA